MTTWSDIAKRGALCRTDEPCSDSKNRKKRDYIFEFYKWKYVVGEPLLTLDDYNDYEFTGYHLHRLYPEYAKDKKEIIKIKTSNRVMFETEFATGAAFMSLYNIEKRLEMILEEIQYDKSPIIVKVY